MVTVPENVERGKQNYAHSFIISSVVSGGKFPRKNLLGLILEELYIYMYIQQVQVRMMKGAQRPRERKKERWNERKSERERKECTRKSLRVVHPTETRASFIFHNLILQKIVQVSFKKLIPIKFKFRQKVFNLGEVFDEISF